MLIRTNPSATIGIVANGAEALATVDQRTSNLLITDNSMPLVDGLTLVRLVRARQAAFPIIVCQAVANWSRRPWLPARRASC